MRATFLAKLAVLILAAIALIYGISIVIGKDAVGPRIIERPETVASAMPAVVLAIPETTPTAAPISATEIPPSVSTPSSAQEKKLEAYQVDVKNSVQLLEEGNATQARTEMSVAIDKAIGDGVSAAQVDVLRNMLMRIEYCKAGPEGMLAWLSTPEAALADTQLCGAVSIDRSRMKLFDLDASAQRGLVQLSSTKEPEEETAFKSFGERSQDKFKQKRNFEKWS